MSLQNLVEVHGDKATTTSLKVAEIFGREHKNVLRDISNLECSAEFNRLNFEPVSYPDSYGREQKAYEMTKDGFTFLAMGFTGAKAAEFKEAYINAFNAMEKALQRRADPIEDFTNRLVQKLMNARLKKMNLPSLSVDEVERVRDLVSKSESETNPVLRANYNALLQKFYNQYDMPYLTKEAQAEDKQKTVVMIITGE